MESILLSDLPKPDKKIGVGFYLKVNRPILGKVLKHLEGLGWLWNSGIRPTEKDESLLPGVDGFDGYILRLGDGLSCVGAESSSIKYFNVMMIDPEKTDFCHHSSHPGKVVSCGIGPGSQSFLYCPVCKIEKT